MPVGELHKQTFRAGSRTYHSSARFFPPRIRDDVYALYGFVRVADDFVDSVPQNATGFHNFRDRYRAALTSCGESGDPIVDSFVALARRKAFDPEWTEAFLNSMEMDLSRAEYDTLSETLAYIYGSAEVIGLFMARIMELSTDSFAAAQMLGRAMQYINFIRDIEEDNRLGRRYLPLFESDLASLHEKEAHEHPAEFRRLIERHLALHSAWQSAAREGFSYIPRNLRIAIKTASDMYSWTAARIADDPFIVFRKKIKPQKSRVILAGLINTLTA